MRRSPRRRHPRHRRRSNRRRPTTTIPTPPDPVAAEAAGDDTVIAAFADRQWRIPLDVDTWPLDRLRHCAGIAGDGSVVVDRVAVLEVIEELLGEQFDEFCEAAPRRGQLVPASHTFAAAVGFPAAADAEGDRWDKAFGAIPRTLAVLHTWPGAVESDLNRFWQIDYRDRWRFDDLGRRRLTLRQIHARITHLPADSALAVAMNRRSPTELLLMDIYEPLAGRAHPARPLTAAQLAERAAEAQAKAKAMADYEARRAARGDRRITDGLATAKANALRGRS